ncbi:Intraflagellar transport protein [Paragonimus heterotremus]|uniref:Intraflagellar transport protein n=1 Tax=Paragonimus heterotremus TaxID=100268 RepID=A0A8J4SQQ7_9TREM|nr:Intraflagellar transport protein [Paragonimus heterotremus]
MRLKYLKTIVTPQMTEARIQCIAWSPNNKKLAVCTHDNVIALYDEYGERRERFAAKAVDTKSGGKRNFLVKSMVFSHDSIKLAIAQSDNIIFVYRLGEDWDEKKVICNKFPQQSAAVYLLWPPGQPIICGLADGKVRAANTQTNKSSTIYNADSYVVSMACNTSGKGFISGHADGKIVRYFFDDEGSGDTQGKLVTHPTAPYALAWAGSTILAAGCDRRIYVYSREGRVLQQFDYSKDDTEKEFTVAVSSPSGHSVAFGSFDRIRIFAWSPRKSNWEECKPKVIKHLYTITSMCWKKDGSKLIVGTLCGGVEQFDCCMKKKMYKNTFELNYVGPSQVIVRNLKTNNKIVVQSCFGYEIDDVRVMGNDRYLVAHSSDTLILGDLKENRLSEVHWNNKGQKAKFYFGHPNLCIIFGVGELVLIEYGVNEILGSVRTEFTNPYLISVRVNERHFGDGELCKKIAYMLDLKTIVVMDLITGDITCQVQHDTKVDWIELNETGHKLLFRDKKLQLLLYDTDSMQKTTLLNLCSYVQWVPQSDVVVAQSRDTLCIWYNIEATDRVTSISLKGGDILDIVRQNGKTEVLVSEGLTTVSYALDDGLIEFGTAMEDNDFERAVAFLESLEISPETKSMWMKLAKASMKAGKLLIAERCYAALHSVSKVRYLRNTREMKNVENAPDYQIEARIAILEKDFKSAEHIYLSQNAIEEVTSMYKDLNKWENAIEEDAASKYIELINDLLAKESCSPVDTADQPTLTTPGLETSVNGGVMQICLSRPEKKNAITFDMYQSWTSMLNKAATDQKIKLVAITGKGDYFSSGNDLNTFTKQLESGVPIQDVVKTARDVLYQFVSAFISFPKTLVALVNGPSVGITVTTLGLYDYVLAAETATFHTPFVTLGQTPEGCSSATFPKIMGPLRANEMLLFNRRLTAREAYDWGLVTRVVSKMDFAGECTKLLNELAQLPPETLVFSKEIMRARDRELLYSVNKMECDRLAERWTSPECIQAITNFLQRAK